MSSTNNIWSMSYSYKITPDSQNYFYNFHHNPVDTQVDNVVQLEMELLRDIDLWVELQDDYPEAMEIINEIRNK